MGFCAGVRRAVDMAREAAARDSARPVFTLGPLIHNARAVASLAADGVRVISEGALDSRVAGSILVIRSHGASPELMEKAKALGAEVLDATCPRVVASQRRAADFSARGWSVVIAGDRGHGEVTAVASRAPGAHVVANAAEAEALELVPPVGLISQTTIKKEEYDAIVAVLSRRYGVVEAADSICPATAERQGALRELLSRVDAVVVVGGKDSANTVRLFRTAIEGGFPAWHIESAAGLPPEAFGFERIGIAAGASTPDEAVDEVAEALASAPARMDAPRPSAGA